MSAPLPPPSASDSAGSSEPAGRTRWDDLYDKLFEEEDARGCDDISEEACRETAGAFFITIASLTLTKLGDALASPKTVLTWLMNALGAPIGLTALLVPLRESLSMLPQLVIGSFVRRLPIRKWVWVGGAIAQAGSLLLMAAAAATLEGSAAGWAIIGALVLFSLARGFCSIAIKDVQGKTIARGRRGRVTGWSAATAGGLTLVAGLMLVGPLRGSDSVEPFIALLLLAAGLWIGAAGVFATIREFPGETGGGRNGLMDGVRGLGLLASDLDFRRFVIARALFLVSALSAPYYVVLAREQSATGPAMLGWFVLAGGVADLASSPFWGGFADRSSRRVLMAAASTASALGLLVAGVVRFLPEVAAIAAIYPAAFLVLAVAHAGVRAGRKTYVLDMAGGNRRTDYVAVSNTVIGALLLASGALGLVAEAFGVATLLVVLSVLGFAGVAVAATLPEVE